MMLKSSLAPRAYIWLRSKDTRSTSCLFHQLSIWIIKLTIVMHATRITPTKSETPKIVTSASTLASFFSLMDICKFIILQSQLAIWMENGLKKFRESYRISDCPLSDGELMTLKIAKTPQDFALRVLDIEADTVLIENDHGYKKSLSINSLARDTITEMVDDWISHGSKMGSAATSSGFITVQLTASKSDIALLNGKWLVRRIEM